jgi:hypothetical protein
MRMPQVEDDPERLGVQFGDGGTLYSGCRRMTSPPASSTAQKPSRRWARTAAMGVDSGSPTAASDEMRSSAPSRLQRV